MVPNTLLPGPEEGEYTFLAIDPNSEQAMQFSTKQFMCLNEAYVLILLANKCSLLNTYNVLGITPCS